MDGQHSDANTDDDHLDANAMAGMLDQIFVSDFTMFRRVCPSCGDRDMAGALRTYLGAGVVLRCRSCGDVAARISEREREIVIEMRGVWSVAVTG